MGWSPHYDLGIGLLTIDDESKTSCVERMPLGWSVVRHEKTEQIKLWIDAPP
jgi:hypothetical protein